MTTTPKTQRCARQFMQRPSGVMRQCLCSAIPRTVRPMMPRISPSKSCWIREAEEKSMNRRWIKVELWFEFGSSVTWCHMYVMYHFGCIYDYKRCGRGTRWQHPSDAFWQKTNSRIGWSSSFRFSWVETWWLHQMARDADILSFFHWLCVRMHAQLASSSLWGCISSFLTQREWRTQNGTWN